MIAFSYDLETPIGQVRLYAGDADPAGLNRTGGDRTRTDEEIAYLLAQSAGDPRMAAAALLEGKAAEFSAVALRVTQGTLAQDFRARGEQMREAARSLREQAGMARWNPPARSVPFPVNEDGAADDW